MQTEITDCISYASASTCGGCVSGKYPTSGGASCDSMYKLFSLILHGWTWKGTDMEEDIFFVSGILT